MVFSEVELVFLAFIFIFALGFLMPLLGARNSISIVKKTKKEKKAKVYAWTEVKETSKEAKGECFYSQCWHF